jgi:uncharacterized protein YecT (DUF1311 family)
VRYCIGLVIAVAWAAVGLAGPTPAWAERRVALSVGIDSYDNLPAIAQLQKAANDAEAVGVALTELGFATKVERNITRLAFTRAWQEFLNKLEPGDTAAFFFAGHGVEIGGLNYLLPRDVPKVGQLEDHVLAEASIRFHALMKSLSERKVRISLFILDACRDNPLSDGAGRTVGGARGLVRVEPPSGTFVMYSAGAGEQALDRLPGGVDGNPNSVYTRTLLPILKTPGLFLNEVAVRVRKEVVALARAVGHEQTPVYYDGLIGEFALKAGAAPVPTLTYPPHQPGGATYPPAPQPKVIDTTTLFDPAAVPSFNCHQYAALPIGNPNRNPHSDIFCIEPALARVDQDLGFVFRQKISGLSGAVRRGVIDAQKRWILERNQRCPASWDDVRVPARRSHITQCLIRETNARIEELRR